MMHPDPTPYPDVNTFLRLIYHRAQAILGDQFVGMYLYGSLALGAFDPQRSDIDFLIVTRDPPDERALAALAAMHAEIAALDSKWATEIEGSYLPRDALRRYDPANALHPHIDRGGGDLLVMPHDVDWVVQRYVLREHGKVIGGPPLDALIDPIPVDDLRRALHDLLAVWWEPMLRDPAPLVHGYLAYAVLTLCRILYTLEHGEIVSKAAAAAWARSALPDHWAGMIGRAAVWQPGMPFDPVEEVQAFIRYTVEQAARMP